METSCIYQANLEQKRDILLSQVYSYRVTNGTVFSRTWFVHEPRTALELFRRQEFLPLSMFMFYLFTKGGNFNDITRVNVSPYLGIDELGAELYQALCLI